MQDSFAPNAAEMLPGLQLQADEHVLLSSLARTRLPNPLMPGTKHPDGFVITDQRLIMLTQPRSTSIDGLRVSILSSMPLQQINCVQVLDIRWGGLSVLYFILLCLFWLIPGVIFFFYMFSRTGLWLVVHSGSASNELKFARHDATSLADAIGLIQKHRTSSR